jgi:alkanesulfonate monooxygenase SsuD/methylene tetrahydromethanopterin reductase-like flavin-dependent oxidoreductase (luciferase family)
MRFGIFGAAQAGSADPGAAMGQGFHDFIDFNVEAEALGYHSTFLVEHHFSGWNQISATLTLLTWLAARTTTLRLGTAVMVLPWHNPVILAEQAATLDLLSGGRLDFGIGKGYRYNEFTGFAIPLEEADARFEEALAIITKAWTSGQRFSHHGRFWTFNDILVEPPTSQKPHPPFWMGAGSPSSIRRVAERGHNLLLDQFASFDVIGERIALFKAERARVGLAPFAPTNARVGLAPFAPAQTRGRAGDPLGIAVARDMHVADNEAAKDAALERNRQFHERILSVARWPDHAGGSHILAYGHAGEEAEANSLIGTPDEIMGKLEVLRRAGVDYVIMNCGGSRESLRRFAREIMSAFSDEALSCRKAP